VLARGAVDRVAIATERGSEEMIQLDVERREPLRRALRRAAQLRRLGEEGGGQVELGLDVGGIDRQRSRQQKRRAVADRRRGRFRRQVDRDLRRRATREIGQTSVMEGRDRSEARALRQLSPAGAGLVDLVRGRDRSVLSAG
jgi:hypothetical protein